MTQRLSVLCFKFYHKKRTRKAPMNVTPVTFYDLNTSPFRNTVPLLIGWTHSIREPRPLESWLRCRLFLLRRPVLLSGQLHKLVLRALFRLPASTLVNSFLCLQASVWSIDWSHFHNSVITGDLGLRSQSAYALKPHHRQRVRTAQTCAVLLSGRRFFVWSGVSKLLLNLNVLSHLYKALCWTSLFHSKSRNAGF